jgi:uncharacterized protein
MNTKSANQVHITSGFWSEIQDINSRQAILHQWEQLERSGCIENFRICAGRSASPRTGLFFSDSDAYKWLDAACRILRQDPRLELQERVDHLTDLILAAQAEDGYIFTYNQIHFPGERWKNLQLEHELYCMGHLIEAGISHRNSTSEETLFSAVCKTADLICRDFGDADWKMVDGHEEIEIALLKLADASVNVQYREMAARFLERRHAGKGYAGHFLKQAMSTISRMRKVEKERKTYTKEHPGERGFSLPNRNQHKTPLLVWPRLILSLISGKFAQRDEPLNAEAEPAGHSVRFAYLETAAAMLARQTGDASLIPGLERKWEGMVAKRMYVTGGIGSLPLIEGFGRDYELNPQVAYAETCAALGSIFWNREMSLLTGNPRYDDLFEWQLHNAAAVGFGADGCTYFYNNPLISDGHVHRAEWYDVPCCPSNLSRTWASLGYSLFSREGEQITIHQYISSEANLPGNPDIRISLESGLPWQGRVRINLWTSIPSKLTVKLRFPFWADRYEIIWNGKRVDPDDAPTGRILFSSASGLEFPNRPYIRLQGEFREKDVIDLDFDLPIKILHQDARIKPCRGMAAVTRGPLVYCLEDRDNLELNLPPRLKRDSFRVTEGIGFFEGVSLLEGETEAGKPVRLIPYHLWGNRGDSRMSVFFTPVG